MTASPLPSTGAVTGLRETLAFFRDPSFASRRFGLYGDVFETSLLGQRIVFIRGEQAIRDLLDQPSALEGWWPLSVRKLLGQRSLANRNGVAHKARRRAVGQLFSAGALRRYAPQITAMVDQLSDELLASDTSVALADRMRRFAFAVIAGPVLGLDADNRDALFLDFEIWTRALFSIPVALPGSPFARAIQARTRLLERLRTVLRGSQGEQGGLDLLSGGLDEAGLPLDDDDLVEQLLLLLFAGYETTASSLSCLFRALLLEPEVERWLREELEEQCWPPEPGADMPRLNAVVREVQRLNPPVGGFFRRCTQDVELAGVVVPADRVIQVALTSTADGSNADHAAFRPQRHLDGSFDQMLFPFGGGERVCLGKALAELEIILMAVGLLRRLRLQLEPDQDLSLQVIPSPTPKGGLLVRATACC